MSDTNTYLDLLRQAHEYAGTPSSRAMGTAAGLSHAAGHKIVTGRVVPHRRTLVALLDALVPPPSDLKEKILAAYDALDKPGRAPAGVFSPAPLRVPMAERDDAGDPLIEAATIIADAIVAGLGDLADAIRQVAAGEPAP